MPAVPAARAKGRHQRGLISREIRRAGQVGIEVRDLNVTGDCVEVVGTPIVYNSGYEVFDAFGSFIETMLPGVAAPAFGQDVRFLLGHDDILPLARTAAGTMTLSDSPTGLNIAASLDRRQTRASDMLIALERGDMTQMSCAFTVAMDEWSEDYQARSIRQFHVLYEVSGVTFPASPTTSLTIAQRAAMAGIRIDTEAVARGLDMLTSAHVESRGGRRVHDEGFPLLLGTVEMLHRLDEAAGVSARASRLHRALRESREGKVLSAANAELLQAALEALHETDDIDIPSIVESLQAIDAAVDAGQQGISAVLGVANPDGDAGDEDPALTEEDAAVDGDGSTADNSDTASADGTGTRGIDFGAMTPAERRSVLGAVSYNDTQSALQAALQVLYPDAADDGWFDVAVLDNSDTQVVWTAWCDAPAPGNWSAPWSTDASGQVVIGEPVISVQRITSWVPAATPASTDATAAARSQNLRLEAERLRMRRR